MPAAAAAIPVNPRSAAMMAIMKNTIAQYNIIYLHKRLFCILCYYGKLFVFLSLLIYKVCKINNATTVTPFVIVPCKDFDSSFIKYPG